jgi:hypothetical protein
MRDCQSSRSPTTSMTACSSPRIETPTPRCPRLARCTRRSTSHRWSSSRSSHYCWNRCWIRRHPASRHQSPPSCWRSHRLTRSCRSCPNCCSRPPNLIRSNFRPARPSCSRRSSLRFLRHRPPPNRPRCHRKNSGSLAFRTRQSTLPSRAPPPLLPEGERTCSLIGGSCP